jgi:hypothetical protein
MKWLRTLNFYQIVKIKNKKSKPIAVDVLFKAYLMVPLSCRSNLTGQLPYSIETGGGDG